MLRQFLSLSISESKVKEAEEKPKTEICDLRDEKGKRSKEEIERTIGKREPEI